MILNKLNQSILLKREVFDAKNPKHIEEVKYFMKNSKWNGICPFFLEWPYLTIPDMIKDKIVRGIVGC
jgi:hypothetical protein